MLFCIGQLRRARLVVRLRRKEKADWKVVAGAARAPDVWEPYISGCGFRLDHNFLKALASAFLVPFISIYEHV